MAYTFDGANKLITLSGNVDTFNVSDLYSRWKEWVQQGDNSKWIVAFESSVGGNALGGGKAVGAYYFLTNGWLIRPEERNYKLSIDGNLFPVPDTAPLFTQTLGAFNVLIEMQTSQLTQLANTGGGSSVWTVQEKQDLISDQQRVRKILSNRSKVINNQLIVYEDDGITEFDRFDLLDSAGNPAEQVIREVKPSA